jgi:hypothetical protein
MSRAPGFILLAVLQSFASDAAAWCELLRVGISVNYQERIRASLHQAMTGGPACISNAAPNNP